MSKLIFSRAFLRNLKFFLSAFVLVYLSINACKNTQNPKPKDLSAVSIDSMSNAIETLPEKLLSYDSLSGYSAFYIDPTTRYAHGILGDGIEAGGLLLKTPKGKSLVFRLDEEFVFEDLAPRLKDLNDDTVPEILCIRSSKSKGASVAIYQLKNEELKLMASSDFIGTANRWLNIAAIEDLDQDGSIEIAWVQTPHIGGILKIANIEGEKLMVRDEYAGVTNHRIGSRNLCLSLLQKVDNQLVLSLPNMSYSQILQFTYNNQKIILSQSFSNITDANVPIFKQVNLPNTLQNVACGGI